MRAANALRGRASTSAVGPSSHDRAAVEDDDPVGQQQCVEDVVGDEDDGAVGQHPAQHLPERRGDRDVERGHRLVEQQQPRVGGEGPGDGDPLRLPAGQLRPACGRRSSGDADLAPASARAYAVRRPAGCRRLRGPKATLSSAVRCGNSSGSWASRAICRSCGGDARAWPFAAGRP